MTLVSVGCATAYLLLSAATHQGSHDMAPYLQHQTRAATPAAHAYNPFAIASKATPTAVINGQSGRFVVKLEAHYVDEARPHIVALRNTDRNAHDADMHSATQSLLNALRPLQTAMTDYHGVHQHWPSPDMLASELQTLHAHADIAALALGTQGDIRLTTSSRFGKDRRLRLTPASTGSRWFCRTNLPNQWLGSGGARLCLYDKHVR